MSKHKAHLLSFNMETKLLFRMLGTPKPECLLLQTYMDFQAVDSQPAPCLLLIHLASLFDQLRPGLPGGTIQWPFTSHTPLGI